MIAGTWSMVFDEHPRAMSAASAFLKLSAVIIWRAVIPFLYRSMTAIPACFASAILAPVTAGIVPFPGRPRPRTSVRQFMLFAVNIPEQDPHPGHAMCSISLSCASVIFPLATAPTPSNMSVSERFLSEYGFPSSWLGRCPGIIAPPETKTVGRSRRAAAISMPGTILSQFGIITRASNWCAVTMHSTLSAISSRVTREYFMPSCPIAIPSHTPIAGNSIGVPPAMRIPALTASEILSSIKWPGIISFLAQQTPTSGRSSSSSV